MRTTDQFCESRANFKTGFQENKIDNQSEEIMEVLLTVEEEEEAEPAAEAAPLCGVRREDGSALIAPLIFYFQEINGHQLP